MATAIVIAPGAQAIKVTAPYLASPVAPSTTVTVVFDDPDLVALAGLVLHFDCDGSGTFSEAIGLQVGSRSPHANLTDVIDGAASGGPGYGYAMQTGYGYANGEHGVPTGNTGGVALGGYGYSAGNGYGQGYQQGYGYGYSYGYDSGYGYGYDSGTLTFEFTWIQPAFLPNETCTLVVEVVPQGRTTGDFESPRSLPFTPRVPPVADAGPDQVGVPGATILLDGSLSYDPNDGPDSPLAYHWVQVAGPSVSLTPVADGFQHLSGAQFVVPPQLDAILGFALTVSDGIAADDSTDVANVTIDLVKAPAGRAALEGELVDAVAQAADFQGLTVQWSIVSGPPVDLSGATSLHATFRAPEVDADTNLTLRITATQGSLARHADVTFLAQDNEAPVADAGPEAAVVAGQPTRLTGASASDPEGDALTYSWTWLDGALVAIGDATQLNPLVTGAPVPAPATATLRLTVTDVHGNVTRDLRHLIVMPGLVGPNAGSDLGVLEGSNVTLDGSGSLGAQSYQWTLPAGITANGPTDQATLAFTAPAAGATPDTYAFALRINGAGPADTVNVTVHGIPASSGAAQDWYLHTTDCVLADLAGLPADPADTATLAAGDDPACLRAALPVLGGPVEFTATAPRAIPAQTQVTGTLQLTALLPTGDAALLPLPGFGSIPVDVDLVQGSTVVAHQHLGAQVDTVLLDIDPAALPAALPGLPLGFTAVPFAFTTSPAIPTGASFALRVTVGTTVPGLVYAIGTQAGAASTFHVPPLAGGASPPTPVAVASGSGGPEGAALTLSGLASTGTGLAYDWVQVGGPHVVLASRTAAQPTFTAPPVLSPTDLTFRLTVQASDGLTAQDDVTVTVTDVPAVNHEPVAQAGQDRVVPPGTTVQLVGSGSDADGDELFGRWTQAGTPLAGGSARNSADDPLSRNVRTFTVPATAPNNRTYTFVWTVRDNNGGVDPDTVTVTVHGAPPSCASTNSCPPPSCQSTNSCPPPSCQSTNTCPPPSCQSTNTCPPPSCQSTNTCPPATCQTNNTCPPPSCASTNTCPTPGPGPTPTPTPAADPDSDGDGIPDRIERLLGSDPFNAASLPSFDISSQLTVTRINGINVLHWPSHLHAMGYQVWSHNSPYVLIGTLDGGNNTSFEDRTGTGKETTEYKLTFFVDKTRAGGYSANGDYPQGWFATQGASVLLAEQVKDLPWWGFLLIATIAALVLAGVVVYARTERPKQ